MSNEAAAQLLEATGLQLKQEQLKAALDYCGGLPLAVLVVRGALEEDKEYMNFVVERLKEGRPISIESNDELMQAVGYSVELLGEEIRAAFYDIAVVLREDLRWCDLQASYGDECVGALERRCLISRVCGDHDMVGYTDEVARVHDVVVTYAYSKCGPGSGNYRTRAFSMEDELVISMDSQVRVRSCVAHSLNVSTSMLYSRFCCHRQPLATLASVCGALRYHVLVH